MKKSALLILMFVATGLLAAASMQIPGAVDVNGNITLTGLSHLQINGMSANDCISNGLENTLFYDVDCDDVLDPEDNDLQVDDTGSRTKCINVDPAHTTTDWLFFRSDAAITITGIDCIVDASTSVVMTLKECSSSAASCGNTEAAITCLTTNTSEASGVDDASVDAGDWMRMTVGTVTGAPTQAELCVTYEGAA